MPFPEFDNPSHMCVFCENLTPEIIISLFSGSVCSACQEEFLIELEDLSPHIFLPLNKEFRLKLSRFKRESEKRMWFDIK